MKLNIYIKKPLMLYRSDHYYLKPLSVPLYFHNIFGFGSPLINKQSFLKIRITMINISVWCIIDFSNYSGMLNFSPGLSMIAI